MIRWRNCFRVGLTCLILFLCIYYFKSVSSAIALVISALSPFFIGIVIAYLLNIIMNFYERHYFTKKQTSKLVKSTKRPLCMVLALLTLLSIIAAVIGLVIPELVSCVTFIISEIPPAISEFLTNDWVENHIPQEVIDTLSKIDWQNYLSKAVSVLQSGFTSVFDVVISAVSSVISGVITGFLSLVFAIYLLLFKETLLTGIKRIINVYIKEDIVKKIMHCAEVCNASFHNYIVGQCTEAVILGVLCIVGMTVLRMPYSIMIGTLVGFTALIPIAGAYIGAIVGAFMILTVSPVKAFIFIIFLIILQQLEGNLIYPKVVGSSIGLPPIFVLLAVTVGGGVAGITGMLLGVPLTAAFYRLFGEYLTNRENNIIERRENTGNDKTE